MSGGKQRCQEPIPLSFFETLAPDNFLWFRDCLQYLGGLIQSGRLQNVERNSAIPTRCLLS
jgi:hypothetical protein